MGCDPNITATDFPVQGIHLRSRAKVLFHFGGPELLGTIVRDDMSAPFRTIIQLDDGRFVLSSECQYSPVATPQAKVGG